MAQYPCDFCGNRYGGPQNTYYPALVDGGISVRRRARLCPICLAGVDVQLLEQLEGPDRELDAEPGCAGCGAEETPRAIFVTLYRAGQDRQDYFGRCCRPCGGTQPDSRLTGPRGPLRGLGF
jgi:hypothetical protein